MTEGTETEIVRIGAKLYAEDPSAIDLGSYVPIFHGWIQRREPDGLPIDVADYAHVPDGPGVMLIGHEADRAVDLGEGRPGALYQRKRDLRGTLEERFAAVLRGAEWTAAQIERDPAADGVRFGRDEILVRIQDRRLAPNDDATLDAVRPALEAALAEVHPGRGATIERVTDDPGGPFRARVRLA
ncbi:MAG: hypothetical protein AB7V42_13140 [Thermoleophilia bacterium]